MNQGEDSGSAIDYATARGRDWPSVRQFNVFTENRVGGLLEVLRQFESTDIRIVSLNIVDSVGHRFLLERRSKQDACRISRQRMVAREIRNRTAEIKKRIRISGP